MDNRVLGQSGIKVSALGLGGWAIGGPFTFEGKPDGWGDVDDDESIRAIRRAVDLGVTFFDTADAYGTGHSERVLGRALAGCREDVVIATKFGFTYDESRCALTGTDASPDYVRRACEASLRRLGTDHIDLYQLHTGDQSEAASLAIRAVLEELFEAGKIRAYGWSTDEVADAMLFADGPNCSAIQHALSVLNDAPEMLAACEHHQLAGINRGPLEKGILTGKFTVVSTLPADDVRAQDYSWLRGFRAGRPDPTALAALEAIIEILRSDGRTPAQGALGWIWARSGSTIPIPGFKTVAQVEENAGAMKFGPLAPDQMLQIESLLRPRLG